MVLAVHLNQIIHIYKVIWYMWKIRKITTKFLKGENYFIFLKVRPVVSNLEGRISL